MGTRILRAHREVTGTRRLFKAYVLVGAVVAAASLAWLGFSPTAADDGGLSGIVIIVNGPGESALSSPELLTGAGNQGKRCSDNQGLDQSWADFKLEGATLSEGPHTSGPLTVTISNLTEDSFDWQSNIGLDAVIVKGGHAGTYLYRYDPPAEATSDNGLAVPDPDNNSISHISFCYDFPDDVEPTPESTPDPGPGAAGDPTPEPTLEPTPDPGTGVSSDPNPELGPEAGTGVASDPNPELGPEAGTGVSSDPDPELGPEAGTGVSSDPNPELGPEAGTGVASDPDPELGPEAGTDVASYPNPEPAPEPGTGITSDPDPELAPDPLSHTSVAHVPTMLPNTGGDPRADARHFPTASMLSLAGLALIVLGGWAARRSRAQQGS